MFAMLYFLLVYTIIIITHAYVIYHAYDMLVVVLTMVLCISIILLFIRIVAIE